MEQEKTIEHHQKMKTNSLKHLGLFCLPPTYVCFPPTSGQVEEERYFEFPECLEVLAEAFAWKLFEGILITLRCLLHLPLLLDERNKSRYPPFTIKY